MIPVIKGVPPKLTVRREAVRRTAGYLDGRIVFVQNEFPRLAPHVGAVERRVNGDVAYNFYAFGVDVLAEQLPLFIEQKLDVSKKLDIGSEFFSVLCEGGGISAFERLFRPFYPGHHSEMSFQSHEKGVVFEPGVLGGKGSHFIRIALPTAVFGFCQKFKAAGINFSVVNLPRIISEITGEHFFFLQKPV